MLKKFILLFLLSSYFSTELARSKQEIFKNHLQKLITANVVWARSYIISILSDSPDKEAIKERLLQNQTKFKILFAVIFGRKNSNKIIELLKEHKAITVNLIEAVKANNQHEVKNLEKNWYKNIKDIAVFINQINPNVSVNYLTNMLNGLLKLTKKEIVLRANKRWKDDIKNFDNILQYASYIANNLSKKIS